MSECQKSGLRYFWVFLSIPLFWWTLDHYRLYINVSSSLPQKYWLVAYGKTPKRQDYVCFKPLKSIAKEYGFSENVTWIKQVLGVPGDLVTRQDRDFYINDQYSATAKTHSLKGEPLKIGPTGTINKGQYYVSTPHKDSFDSRYEKMGWLNESQTVGVAYPLW